MYKTLILLIIPFLFFGQKKYQKNNHVYINTKETSTKYKISCSNPQGTLRKWKIEHGHLDLPKKSMWYVGTMWYICSDENLGLYNKV